MHIVSLGLDQKTLEPDSVVAMRNREYGKVVGKYTIFVPARETSIVSLSDKTTVYAVGGNNKVSQLWRMYTLASALMRKESCDVVSSQDTYFLGLIGLLLSRKYHCGFEVQVLGIEKLNIVRKLMSKYVLAQASSIRVLGLRLKKRLVDEFGIKEDRMMLVPIYVDVSSLGLSANPDATKRAELETHVEAFRKEYEGRFNIVSVNRLVPIKNIPMQLLAVAKLKDEFPKLLLHVVGDGPDKELLQKQIEALGIGSHAILHGPKFGVELSSFFTQADCFVLTSDFEGYGMVIVEAATAGACIVMTDVGCAGEVIVHEESGLVVEPRDTEGFVAALRRVIVDEQLRHALEIGAQRSIAELPSFDMVLEKYRASWQQALENKK